MPVPKRRTSRSKKRQRRSHDALRPSQWSVCPKCKESVLPHRVCPSCGHYRGRPVVAVDQS